MERGFDTELSESSRKTKLVYKTDDNTIIIYTAEGGGISRSVVVVGKDGR